MRTLVKLAAIAALCVVGGVALLVVTNPAPDVPARPAGDAGASAQPIVIKLHARWCPVCMFTRDDWADIADAYAGRVQLVVFDFTTDGTTAASREHARRLGLETVFDDFVGETGTVLVLDGPTKTVRDVIHGVRDPQEYRIAIDRALETAAAHSE